MVKLYSLLAVLVASSFCRKASAQNELIVGDVKVGDLITLSDGSKWYVGTNEVTNGSFDMDPSENNGNIVGWTVGSYAQMTSSNFSWQKTGGYDGGAYIQAVGHTGAAGVNSIGQRWSIQPNTRYYFSFYLAKNSANNQYVPVVSMTAEESTAGGQHETSVSNGQMIIGMNGGTETTGLQPLGYGNYVDEDGDGVGDWCQTACSFNSQEYTYLQFNARWLMSTVCFDGFFLAQLYDPEETSQSTVAYLGLQAALNNLGTYYSGLSDDYSGIISELDDFANEGDVDGESISNLSEDSELTTLQNAIDLVNAMLESAKAAVANAEAFNDLMVKAASYLEADDLYPGYEDLQNKLADFEQYQLNGFMTLDNDKSSLEYVSVAISELNAAINDYLFSQTATEETPANYSFLIDEPMFTSKGEWYIGTSGGDQRVNTSLTDNEGNAITCWNAWRNQANFTDNTIQQDLTGIPNGYYTVSADMCTQDGCITDQHLFATSSTATSVSANLSQTGWDPYVWENLTTEKILVVDGKLKIGATSNGMSETPGGYSDYRGGWYCVTNFVLNYYGTASDEDIAQAVAGKFAEAEAMSDTMHLAADKVTFVAAVAEAKSASDLDALNAAIAIATASETEYASVMSGTYKTLNDSIAKTEGTNFAKITKVVVDITTNYLNSAEATYNETGNYTSILRSYLNDLTPAIASAEAAVEDVTSAEGKAVLNSTIDDVVNRFAAVKSLPTSEAITEAISELNNAITVAKAADVEVANGADVTAYISDAAISSATPTGWNIYKPVGDGSGAKNGQAEDGVSDNYYIDTWNATAGAVRATYYQTLNVPNGKYKLSAMMRASGAVGAEGVYLMASDAALATNEDEAVIPTDGAVVVLAPAHVKPTNLTKYVDSSLESVSGGDSIAYTFDTYGELWTKAADELISKYNLTAATQFSIYESAIETLGEYCPDGISEESWTILGANGGKGRGWMNVDLEIEVKNHVLTVGLTNDSVFTKGLTDTQSELAVPFSGSWFSAHNFTLVLLEEGDNAGWNVTTGVESIAEKSEESEIENVFTVSGVRVNGLKNGINIVKMSDGSVKKVIK